MQAVKMMLCVGWRYTYEIDEDSSMYNLGNVNKTEIDKSSISNSHLTSSITPERMSAAPKSGDNKQ